MIVKIVGDNETADRARHLISASGGRIVEHMPAYVFVIRESETAVPIVDGVDSPFEAKFVNMLTELAPSGSVVLQRAGGNRNDRVLHLTVPATDADRYAASLAIYRTVAQLSKRRRGWLKWLLFPVFLFLAVPASAQVTGGVVDQGKGNVGSARAWYVRWDVAQNIVCVSGCGAPSADGTTFTAGATAMNLIGGAFNDALAAVTSGTMAAPRITAYRAFHVNIRDSSGNENGAAHPLYVNCSSGCSAGTPGQATMAASSPVVIASDQTAVHTICDSGCAAPAATADGTAFTFGTTNVSPVAFVVDDVAPNAVAENSYGAARMTGNRILYGDISKSASNTNSFKVDFGGSAQPISASSLPLPTGAATSANQLAIQSGQTASAVNTCQFDVPATSPANHDYTTQRCGQFREGLVRLLSSNGSTLGEPGATYPLTMMFPYGSTTSTASFTAIAQTQTYGASSADNTAKGAIVLHVQGTWVGTIEVRGRTSSADSYSAIPAVNLATGVAATTVTANGFYVIPSSWIWDITFVTTAWTSGQADVTSATSAEVFANVIASPAQLATGAATSALQTTANSSLSSIDGKVPALGQALAAASVPVVLTAAQLTTLTPPAAITGYALDTSLTTVNATLTAIQTVLQSTAGLSGRTGLLPQCNALRRAACR